MWPFKKDRKAGPIVPDPEGRGWVNMKGTIQGLPAYIRYDSTLKKVAPHPDYRHEVLVTIAFNSARENGLPASEDDLCAVDDIEDLFKSRLEKDQTAVLALVITTGGVRELYFYSSDPDNAIRHWEDYLQPRMDTHQVEFVIRPDADWEIYHKFA
jgi:Family of unknown function (DUF695)